MKLLLLAVFFICAVIVTGDFECDRYGILFYEELGCKALHKPGQFCPFKYQCPPYEMGQLCNFHGKRYDIGEHLNQEEITKSCHAGCFCEQQRDKPLGTRLTCANLDCPENTILPLPLGSYHKYTLGKCCANITEVVDPPYTGQAQCMVEGHTYYEGQRFSPKSSCLTCVCQKGFQGKFENPFCERKSCGFEIWNPEDIANKCAPVYFVERKDEILCCPVNFICPEKSDIIKSETTLRNHDDTCDFGSIQIKADQYVERQLFQWGKTRNIKCTCYTPPLLTCFAYY